MIDYSLLVKDADVLTNQCEDEETAMQSLLNQKNYLEERNRFVLGVEGWNCSTRFTPSFCHCLFSGKCSV